MTVRTLLSAAAVAVTLAVAAAPASSQALGQSGRHAPLFRRHGALRPHAE